VAALRAGGVSVPHEVHMAGVRALTSHVARLEAGGDIDAVATDVT
jgi:hypothetical protein